MRLPSTVVSTLHSHLAPDAARAKMTGIESQLVVASSDLCEVSCVATRALR